MPIRNATLVKCSMITDHSLTLSNSSGYQMKTHLCITKMEIYKKFGHLCSTLQRLQTNLYRQTCRACKKSPIWHQQISMNLIVSCNILPELHYKFYSRYAILLYTYSNRIRQIICLSFRSDLIRKWEICSSTGVVFVHTYFIHSNEFGRICVFFRNFFMYWFFRLQSKPFIYYVYFNYITFCRMHCIRK